MSLEEAGNRLLFSNSQQPDFFKARQDLYTAMYDIYDLSGEYAVVFSNVIGVTKDLKLAAGAIETAQARLSEVVAPVADPADPPFVQIFLARCDQAVLKAALAECATARELASVISGRARGILMSTIIRPNFIGLVHFTQIGSQMGRLMSLGRGKPKSKSGS